MARLKRVKVDRLRGEPSRYQIVGQPEHYVVEQAIDMDGNEYGWTLLDERFDVLDRARLSHVKYQPLLADMRDWLDDGRDLAIHERAAQRVLKERGQA